MDSKPSGAGITPSSVFWITIASLHLVVISGAEEYCITESLKASCKGESQVILMEHARYGRMELGRCVARNFGNIGCAKDVLNIMDYMCSGRKSCEVSVSDPALVRTQPCPLDFSSYLEVQYQCIEVLQLPREACKHDGRHIQSQRVGFLSPLSSKHVRHEKRCPLVIKAEPGQRISFTLYDFAFRNETGPRFSTEQYCQQYFVIREPFVGSDVTICSGDERERPQVYISRTHEVAVELSAKSDQPTFIIKYEVIGCPRLKTPEGTVVTYNDDVIKVSCNNSRESFTLKCVNNTWFGELRNCSIPVPNGYDDGEGGTSIVSLPPLGISIVIILGVAMVIVVYVAVMIVCVLYIKKRRRRRTLRGETDSSDLTGPDADRIKMAAAKDRELAAEEQLPMLGGKTTVVCATPGECPDMCELHEMRPCTICNSCSTYMSGQHGLTLGRDEGHYGRPTAAPTALLAANGQGLKLSPSKDAASNLPQAVRVPLSHGSPARAVTYQIQERIVRPLAAVDDRRMYAESPYGFPGSYFKTFVKPLGNPAVVPELGGSAGGADSGTSPDIVPEYCGQNSTNAAIARSVANQQRQVAANTPPSAANT